MGTTFDAIKQAEKEKLLGGNDMQLFDAKSTKRVKRQRESDTAKSNGKGSISPRAMEEYNHLKQSIVSLLPKARQRALLFAGATEEDGNSDVIAKFSLVMASAGEKLLLVDTNLRNPVLHDLFRVEAQGGLADLLSGEEKLERVIKPTHLPNLSIVTAGNLPSNPSSLFALGKLDVLVRDMKTQADWVLFDAPAINMFNDAVILGRGTDGVVLVLRAEHTRWEVAQNARERLESGKANILGVVLNDRKFHIPGWIYRRL